MRVLLLTFLALCLLAPAQEPVDWTARLLEEAETWQLDPQRRCDWMTGELLMMMQRDCSAAQKLAVMERASQAPDLLVDPEASAATAALYVERACRLGYAELALHVADSREDAALVLRLYGVMLVALRHGDDVTTAEALAGRIASRPDATPAMRAEAAAMAGETTRANKVAAAMVAELAPPVDHRPAARIYEALAWRAGLAGDFEQAMAWTVQGGMISDRLTNEASAERLRQAWETRHGVAAVIAAIGFERSALRDVAGREGLDAAMALIESRRGESDWIQMYRYWLERMLARGRYDDAIAFIDRLEPARLGREETAMTRMLLVGCVMTLQAVPAARRDDRLAPLRGYVHELLVNASEAMSRSYCRELLRAGYHELAWGVMAARELGEREQYAAEAAVGYLAIGRAERALPLLPHIPATREFANLRQLLQQVARLEALAAEPWDGQTRDWPELRLELLRAAPLALADLLPRYEISLKMADCAAVVVPALLDAGEAARLAAIIRQLGVPANRAYFYTGVCRYQLARGDRAAALAAFGHLHATGQEMNRGLLRELADVFGMSGPPALDWVVAAYGLAGREPDRGWSDAARDRSARVATALKSANDPAPVLDALDPTLRRQACRHAARLLAPTTDDAARLAILARLPDAADRLQVMLGWILADAQLAGDRH